MLRYTVLSVLLVACHARARAADADDTTAEWLMKFPDDDQNNKDKPSGQGKDLTATDVDSVVNWVKDIMPLPTDSEARPNNTKKKVNLDPSNIVIKNSSLSLPAEPTNKFSDTTPYPETPCISDDGVTGVCVLYYLCDVTTRKVIADGTNLLDIRSGGTTKRGCAHYLEICCQLEDRVNPQQDAVPVVGFQSKPFEDDYKSLAPDASNIDPKRQVQCGWNNPKLFLFGEDKAVDGDMYANYGEFPWMVALLRKSGTEAWAPNDYIGGGSLIHPSVVITAYHKLRKITAEELKCRAGEWDTQTDKEQYKIQERDADRFVSHPDFYLTSLYNDVALIFLKKPFDLAGAPHIDTACLAPVLPVNANCFGMGWGKDAKNEKYVQILKKVPLSLVEHQTCETLLHTNTRFRLIPQFKLDKSLTCAGGEEYVDTCQGDGGSPLVCKIDERDNSTRYAVVGIVAYGLACGTQGVPGVYVNVPHLYPWVQQQMADNGYTNDTYTY